ncbi:putative ABC transporter arginine-binding protein ArtJ precursor [Marinomonas aquimarina]|uniref:Putative ABC transporter arginine-binding protein ArtJ n=1 Tax=Marinomonas aquimarina TaxID=295068 RepID=A0A1A8T8J1_9GAMM|nr:transporter substrate-binding domain-containing protein [Marinomonas aquimarina]SBS28701.1 putative ABC transporter arginine-binding protein ArtJ precursor [Marinomonas aquimarina]
MERLRRLIVLSVLLMLAGTSLASENKVLRVGLAEDFAPFYYQDQQGLFHGASYEILLAVTEKLGYQLKVRRYPSMQLLLAEMRQGKVDINPNLSNTPQRAEVALFTQTPHIFETQDIITRADHSINFSGHMLQLAPYRIGVNFGWTYGKAFDSADYLNKAYKADSVAQLKGLLAGEYDVAINNRQFFMETAAKLKASQAFEVVATPVYRLPVTIAIAKSYNNASVLRDQLEVEIVKFKVTDEYKDILTRYGFQSQLAEEGEAL